MTAAPPPAALWAQRALVAALSLLLLAACTQNQTQVRSTGTARVTAEAHDHSLTVPDHAKRVELLIDLTVEAGAVSWELTDPHGNLREEGSAEANELNRELRFDPVAGEWRLHVSYDEMSGAYDFRLRARW